MRNIKRTLAGLALGSALVGCGGIGSFDEFVARVANLGDFAARSFIFDWLPVGNPIDPDLGAMIIDFGAATANSGLMTITENDGGSASGTYAWSGPELTMTINSKSGDIGLDVGQTVKVEVQADQDDGRIRIIQPGTSTNVTSQK